MVAPFRSATGDTKSSTTAALGVRSGRVTDGPAAERFLLRIRRAEVYSTILPPLEAMLVI